jgi:hypothetical protein
MKSNYVSVNEEGQLLGLADGFPSNAELKEMARHIARNSHSRGLPLVRRLGEILNHTMANPASQTRFGHIKPYFQKFGSNVGKTVYQINKDLKSKFPTIYTHNPVPPPKPDPDPPPPPKPDPKPEPKPRPDKNSTSNNNGDSRNNSSSSGSKKDQDKKTNATTPVKAGTSWWLIGGLTMAALGSYWWINDDEEDANQ